MNGNSLLTQLGIVGISVAIILTFIQPALTRIGDTQDEIVATQDELNKINEVQASLADLINRANSISLKDRTLLRTYLPDYVDEVLVLKNISEIATQAKIELTDLAYGGQIANANNSAAVANATPAVVTHTFDLSFISSYESVKDLFALLETNNYPLDIQSLSIKPDDGGLLHVDLTLQTYSHLAKVKS